MQVEKSNGSQRKFITWYEITRLVIWSLWSKSKFTIHFLYILWHITIMKTLNQMTTKPIKTVIWLNLAITHPVIFGIAPQHNVMFWPSVFLVAVLADCGGNALCVRAVECTSAGQGGGSVQRACLTVRALSSTSLLSLLDIVQTILNLKNLFEYIINLQ